MTAFPRGAVDDEGRRAVVHDRQGTLLAVDLDTGAVRWRHGRDLRPVVIHAGSVVAVRVSAPGGVEIVVLDAEDGRERWVSRVIPLPEWARPALDDTPGFRLWASVADHDVVISWVARARFEGGAPPSPRALEELAGEARGAVRVDLESRSVTILPEPPPSEPVEPDEPAAQPGSPRGADVLDQADIGPIRVELAVRSGPAAVVLRAADRRTGEPRWEVVLDETVESRARALRP